MSGHNQTRKHLRTVKVIIINYKIWEKIVNNSFIFISNYLNCINKIERQRRKIHAGETKYIKRV